MSVNKYNPATGELERIAGGTLYVDAPVGSIQAYGGTTAPSGWLLCQGQAVSRTTYAELFKAIGTAFGAGDGSTTFNVPDLREAVPVGAGENDIQTIEKHDVYTLGEFKDDQLQSHTHIYTRSYTGSNNMLWHLDTTSTVAAGTGSDNPTNGTGAIKEAVGRTGTTTHGKQLGVNYIIKAKHVAMPFDMAEYIRNQNVLSEWEEPIFDGDSFTAQYDGILNAWLSSDVMVNATMYINSVQIARLYPNTGIDSGIQLPIKKGDVLTFSLSLGAIANIYKKVAYYKLRDYTGR